MALNIIILSAGITDLTTALALTKQLPSPKPKIKILELRSAPLTIGGAVNLTPKALRYLDHLAVHEIILANDMGADCKTIELFDLYSGTKSSELDSRGEDENGIGKDENKKYFASRVMSPNCRKLCSQMLKNKQISR